MKTNTFVGRIAGRNIEANIELQDVREGEPDALGGLQALVRLIIDGRGGYQLCLQNEGNGELMVATAAAGMEDEHDAVAEALGRPSEDFENPYLSSRTWLDDVMDPVIAKAQELLDELLASHAKLGGLLRG